MERGSESRRKSITGNRGRLITTDSWVAWQGWKGIFSHDGGWLAAGKAINAIGEVLRERGVNFGFGR